MLGRAVAPTAVAPPLTITSLPRTVNLEVYQGDDLHLDLTVTNPDGSAADLHPGCRANPDVALTDDQGAALPNPPQPCAQCGQAMDAAIRRLA